MFRSITRAFLGTEGDLSERQGAVLVATAGVVFSLTAIAYRAVEAAGDWQFLAYRGATTAAAMLVLVGLRHSRRPIDLRRIEPTVVLAGILLAATSMLYILALARTTAAITLFTLAAAPVVAAVIGWIVLREPVTRPTILAIVATAVGIAIMVWSGLEAGSGAGVLLAAITPFTIGSYNVALRSVGHVDPIVPALIAGTLLAVVSAMVALGSGEGLAISGRDAALASLTGGFALGVGLPMFNLGHHSVSAARVSLLLMTEIVLAPLWVWIWPGETPRTATLVGGAIVLGTVVWLLTRSDADRVTAPPSTLPVADT
ncbi:MAG: DMT family transporter [Acidimicrobiia bacterium]|nr:DMT family transporter [Acidimicrobiia bacterium]